VIEAMPAILARHPNTVYRIVGATHPALVAREGEAYRHALQALAQRLGVADHIQWDDRFLETDELLDQLEACDIFLTPYPNLQQSTSGTLSYAVALGKAVVSTPFSHARELLADGVGTLVEPGSANAIAQAVIDLLADATTLETIKRRAYAKGRDAIWPRVAEMAQAVLRVAAPPAKPLQVAPGKKALAGVFAMSDSTGIYQHSLGIVPDRRHGYCLDDNARALMLMNVARDLPAGERLRWSMTYASFIAHAWNEEERCFRNFMSFDRRWLEDRDRRIPTAGRCGRWGIRRNARPTRISANGLSRRSCDQGVASLPKALADPLLRDVGRSRAAARGRPTPAGR
jgi:hypothetical protein